jgi:hypothetical protein
MQSANNASATFYNSQQQKINRFKFLRGLLKKIRYPSFAFLAIGKSVPQLYIFQLF